MNSQFPTISNVVLGKLIKTYGYRKARLTNFKRPWDLTKNHENAIAVFDWFQSQGGYVDNHITFVVKCDDGQLIAIHYSDGKFFWTYSENIVEGNW